MLTYTKLARKPKQFHAFTGITVRQFDFLYRTIKKQYTITEQKRLSKRERQSGAVRPCNLPVREQIQMLLIYYRCYTSYDLLEYLFGVDASTACRDIRNIEPAVKQCIPIPAKKYADAKKATTIEELQRHFPEFQIIVDGTEQSRPKDKKKRYSLLGQKEEAYHQESIHSKSERRDNPQATALS